KPSDPPPTPSCRQPTPTASAAPSTPGAPQTSPPAAPATRTPAPTPQATPSPAPWPAEPIQQRTHTRTTTTAHPALLGAAGSAAGPTRLEAGGTLAVQYTGDGVSKTRRFNPPKQYAASYKAPDAAGFLGTDQPTTTPPAAAPTQQTAPPATPVAAQSGPTP